MARFVLHVSWIQKQAHAEEVMGPCGRTREKWMELCAQAANEQDSQKLMALIEQITALLGAKQERLNEKDSHRLKSKPTG